MTKHRGLKQRIRARKAKTGESYTTAHLRISGDAGQPTAAPTGEDLALLFRWGNETYARGRLIELGEADAGHIVQFYRLPTSPMGTLTAFDGTARELSGALGRVDPLPPLSVPVLDGDALLLDEPGLVIILGIGGTGMTALTTLLAASMRSRCTLTRVGVPDGGYQGQPIVSGAIFDAALRSSLPYHCIDSLKHLTISGGRPFVEGGIPIAFFVLIHELNLLAVATNRLLFATVNPLLGPGEDYERFCDRVRGTGVSVIETRSCEVPGSGEAQPFSGGGAALSSALLTAHVQLRSRKRAWDDRDVRLRFENAAALEDFRGKTTPLTLDLGGAVKVTP